MIVKSKEKKENSLMELIVEVSAEEFDAAMGEAYKKNRNSISVPGFRKGKAPRKIVERMYGASIFHSDAMESIMPSVLELATKDLDIKSVGQPQVTDIDFKEGGSGVDVKIEVAGYPEVKLGEYKGLSAVKPPVEVLDSEVDKEVESIRKRNARFEATDRPAIMGDTAVIDFEGFVDGEAFEGGTGEGHELLLGSERFIPGFEEKILGMKTGEERDIDLVFPDEYTPPLAGKPVVFKVKLKELREEILPELDDEFAMDVSEFDTLDEYRDSIRDNMAKIKQTDSDAVFEDALVSIIVKSMEADVPEVMIEEQIDAGMQGYARQIAAYGMDPRQYLQMTGMTPESLRDSLRETSEKQVMVMLALEKIAELEGIEISEEELENEYKEASERFGFDPEKVKENVPEESIKREALLKRALKIVTDSATALDKAPDAQTSEPDELATGPDTLATESDAQTTEPDAQVTEPEEKEAPKKPAARKTAAKKTTVAADGGAEADVPEIGAEQKKKPAAKKPAAKKTKPEAVNED